MSLSQCLQRAHVGDLNRESACESSAPTERPPARPDGSRRTPAALTYGALRRWWGRSEREKRETVRFGRLQVYIIISYRTFGARQSPPATSAPALGARPRPPATRPRRPEAMSMGLELPPESHAWCSETPRRVVSRQVVSRRVVRQFFCMRRAISDTH